MRSKQPQKGLENVGLDTFGFHIYKLKEPALVRFSDYHPQHHTESYFYNVLLDKVCSTLCLSQGL